MKRWFITAATRARGQSNDLNREILASNLFNCHKEVINAPPVPSISRCIHIVYRHKNVWEYQWSNFIYNCMSTFLHYVHCKDALLDCSAPGGERCESLTWVDVIAVEQSFLSCKMTQLDVLKTVSMSSSVVPSSRIGRICHLSKFNYSFNEFSTLVYTHRKGSRYLTQNQNFPFLFSVF